MASTKPDLFVGIDVGMTCTGVAFAITHEKMTMSDAHVITKWPGNFSAQSNKVPTQLCYTNGQLQSWGFSVNHEDDHGQGLQFVEWFKIFLDPDEYNKRKATTPNDVPSSHQQVRLAYRDFLQQLCIYIQKQLEDQVRSWQDATIEFSFTVPTTWTKISVINDFKSLAREAGFGQGGLKHTIQIGLTEAEAAAVYTLKTQSANYEDGDILLIIDAGGGTTDLALLKVQKRPGQPESLTALDMVRGDEIGSSEIDTAFEAVATQRLLLIHNTLRRSPSEVAWEMTRKYFQHHKEEFGTEDSMRRDRKAIVVPGLSDTFDSPQAGIENGKMIFSIRDFAALFDTQLNKIFDIVDFQVGQMERVANQHEVTHFILSGGLGSSEYVKTRLRERYITPRVPMRYISRGLRILTSTQPQLAVAKGLVQDRMHKLTLPPQAGRSEGPAILTSRIARQSFGIVCMQERNPAIHQGQTTFQDPVDGKTYVGQQITWLIKKGQSITSDTISHKFFRTILKGAPREAWTSEIATSHNKLNDLPTNLLRDGAKVLCRMNSNLTSVPLSSFEKYSKPWWSCDSSGPKSHYKAMYEIKFNIQPAGVEFQLWFNGKQYSEPGSFEVHWDEGAHMAAKKEHVGFAAQRTGNSPTQIGMDKAFPSYGGVGTGTVAAVPTVTYNLPMPARYENLDSIGHSATGNGEYSSNLPDRYNTLSVKPTPNIGRNLNSGQTGPVDLPIDRYNSPGNTTTPGAGMNTSAKLNGYHTPGRITPDPGLYSNDATRARPPSLSDGGSPKYNRATGLWETPSTNSTNTWQRY